MPGHVESAVYAAYFECRNGAGDASPKRSSPKRQKGSSSPKRQQQVSRAESVLQIAAEASKGDAPKAVLAAHMGKLKSNIGRDIDGARAVFRDALGQYPSSKFLCYTYMLWELSVYGIICTAYTQIYPDGEFEVLQKAWQIVKSCKIPDAKKNDLGQLVLQTLVERAAPLALVKQIERSCDGLVRDSVQALISGSSEARLASTLDDGKEPAAKMQRAADGSRVAAEVTSSWRF